MQNYGKHSRPDQEYGQQANRPADMGRQAPARPQQPYDQQGYQRPPYQQPRYAQQPGQPQPQNVYGNPYGRRDFDFQPLPNNHEHDGMIRVKKKRRKKHTKLIVCLVVIACLLVGACGYGAALALSAKDVKAQAETALSNVNGIQTAIAGQDFATAAKNASNLQSSAQAMNDELSSPVWNVAAMLPVVGSDVRGVQTLASALTDASENAIVPLTSSLSTTPPSACIDANGNLNIAAITALLDAIQDGAPAMQRCTDELSSLPAFHIEKLQKLVGPAQDKITGINDVFQQANTFAPIIGSMLGANGNRTYLLAAQNTAEIRASGGFPGSMGTVSIDNGAIELGDFTKVYDMMAEETPAQCAITDEENALFYPWYTQYSWDNSFNPDYPRVAGIWATAYQEKTGQSVDGVISITPTMVQDLLAATGGSFTLSDGTTIDGTNASKVLQHDLYWKYFSSGSSTSESNDACDALFAEAAEYAFDSALDNMNASSLMKLASTMMGGLDDRRIMIWLANASEQSHIENMGYSGSMTAASKQQPTLGVFVNFWAGSKLGWWLGMDTQIGNPVTGNDGSRTYHVTTTLTNFMTAQEAKEGGSYIVSDNDKSLGDADPFIYFYAPAGGTISDVTASNGATIGKATYQGLDVTFTCQVGDYAVLPKPNNPLPVESTVTYSYTVTLPAGVEGDLQLATTPTLTKYHQ